MVTEYTVLADLSNSPVLIAPGSEARLTACLKAVSASDDYDTMMMASRLAGDDDNFWAEDEWTSRYRPYVVVDGILQVPVTGVLLHRFPYQMGRYATGYVYIERAIRRGLDDPEVKGIALVCDSPGGEVAGCFELADFIYSKNGDKPIRAYAADHAYSAAYALASSARTLTVTRSGGVGSVGVLTAHVEYSDALKKMGVNITLIFAGKHKVDGNPYEKLPDSVKGRIQDRIDRIYGQFTSLVARNRGMEDEAVRATEALTYDAQEAISIGFADRVGEVEDEMLIFQNEVAEMENETMTTKPQNAPAATSEEKGTKDDQFVQQAVASARAEGVTEGATSERGRIKAILDSDAAKTRPQSATKLAFNDKLSALSAEDVVSMLADLPEEKAQTPTNPNPAPEPAKAAAGNVTPFEAVMHQSGNPNVGAEATAPEPGSPQAESDTILGALAAASGMNRKSA